MKIQKAAFLRALLAISTMAGGGIVRETWADESAGVFAQTQGGHDDPVSGAVTDFSFYLQTNYTFGVFDSFRLEKNFSYGGAYAYYNMERNIVGGFVYHNLRISGSAINGLLGSASDGESASYVMIDEDMMIKYLQDSETDTPPTQVSFQMSSLVQGQLHLEQPGWSISVDSGSFGNNGDSSPDQSGTTIAISTNLVSSVFTEGLNTSFQLQCDLNSQLSWSAVLESGVWVSPGLANTHAYYNQAATYDLRYYFQGYVNIVDQSGQPIPASKLKFLCVDPRPYGLTK